MHWKGTILPTLGENIIHLTLGKILNAPGKSDFHIKLSGYTLTTSDCNFLSLATGKTSAKAKAAQRKE